MGCLVSSSGARGAEAMLVKVDPDMCSCVRAPCFRSTVEFAANAQQGG